VTYNLLFGRWPRLEIDRVVSEVTASLTVAYDEGDINIAELCKLVSLIKVDFLLFSLSLLLLGSLIAIISRRDYS